MSDITSSPEWLNLESQHNELKNRKIRDLFTDDEMRVQKLSLTAAGLYLDYSKNLITTTTRDALVKLAERANLIEHRNAMFAGAKINNTEQRPVLHTALRAPRDARVMVDGQNVINEVYASLDKMEHCVNKLRTGKWHGFSGKAITDVVNIGIGGSDLGPAMVIDALRPYVTDSINFHFVSNVDGTHISETIKYLNPETTLFIIASKTFTTQETLANAVTAKEWLEQKATHSNAIAQHLIAVTAKPKRAAEFGILDEHIFPFWDWVGGRYSLWSAIGLSIAIAIGMPHFREFLAGAHAMDRHFYNAPLVENMPVILGLIDVWNSSFLNYKTHAVLPYDQYLHLLPKYLQQLEMESNGKRVNRDGIAVPYATSPVLWGSPGTNGQHAFHQLIMQGTQNIAIDFIFPLKSHNPIGQHHLLLAANCFAQAQAMMQGKDEAQIVAELIEQGMEEQAAKLLAPHKVIPGNNPSNTILAEKITPETLGALIALYEHKVFVAGVIWNINSFDQWGVELGKQLAKKLIPDLQGKSANPELDASTRDLIEKFMHQQ